MSYWRFRTDANYQNLLVEKDFDFWRQFDEHKFVNNWEPFEVQINVEGEEIVGDFPSPLIVWTPVFGQKALQILYPLIQKDVEVLPLICRTEQLYLINVTTIIDCLDYTCSEFERFESGRIMQVIHYCFKKDIIYPHIFRIRMGSNQVDSWVCVSNLFKEAVEHSKLKGVLFEPLP
jgi:hypothetical protein